MSKSAPPNNKKATGRRPTKKGRRITTEERRQEQEQQRRQQQSVGIQGKNNGDKRMQSYCLRYALRVIDKHSSKARMVMVST